MGSDLGAAVKGFRDGVKDGAASTADAPKPPSQQVTNAKPADANTVDVEAKTKS
jgi:sec-independent protein translocase protein TatA